MSFVVKKSLSLTLKLYLAAIMNSSETESFSFPAAPARIFLVGIGGIGMSALAQLLVHLGYQVAGSDRGLKDPDKQDLYEKLARQGIALFPQDGSGIVRFRPDCLIHSAAIEAGNPDFLAAEGIPLLHRASALAQCLNRIPAIQVAVAGSCGKTSVTGWLSSALRCLGHRILMVNGGYCNNFENATLPGNFFADENPEFLLVEVDESDRSIREFSPDYAILLNIGNDHYSADELQQVFTGFLQKTRRGAALPAALQSLTPEQLPVHFFSEQATAANSAYPENYQATPEGCQFQIHGFKEAVCCLQNGLHSAWNAAAILQMLAMLLPEKRDCLPGSLNEFRGVRQRFELVSEPGDACPRINDYAHNPEKIAAALATARERFGSPLLALFQPHGFAPFGFMRGALKEVLRTALHPGDQLILLPVYYAGGSSSHSPTSQEVAQEYQAAGLPVLAADNRAQAEQMVRDYPRKTCILVMGARDASLRNWTRTLQA